MVTQVQAEVKTAWGWYSVPVLIGYVSDERYLAIGDVLLEFEREGRSEACVRSTPRGAVYADIEPGTYRVSLCRTGYGSKTVEVAVDPAKPYQFRLLSDCLLGYVWPKWVQTGERSEFRVHAVEAYHLSLWRYGLKKELVRNIGWFDEHGPRATMQVTPDGDYVQTGVEWNKRGYASPHHTQFVTGPERSGLYYLHAKGESGAFFSFPWIVAPAKPQARIAVVMSTTNWNAYNNFGGRSNYVHPEGLPATPPVNSRLDLERYREDGFYSFRYPNDHYPPISFERPEIGAHVPENTQATDPIAGRQASHLAPAEWRLLAWLEREGFAHDVYSESQLHYGQLDLDAYSVLISSVHPEYVTRPMFDKIKSWVHQRGGKFAYLGANGYSCEVEFPDEGRMRCKTQMMKQDGSGYLVDPTNPNCYESRMQMVHEPDGTLLGVTCSALGLMTGAPYRVIDPTHWVFAGTGLREGDLFGTESLQERCPGGASGHEMDRISRYAPEGTKLLAKGLNPEDGGAEMAYYETASGGAVFAASSITWPASLLVDTHVSRITANVLTRFLAG